MRLPVKLWHDPAGMDRARDDLEYKVLLRQALLADLLQKCCLACTHSRCNQVWAISYCFSGSHEHHVLVMYAQD
jgi:hypothetical protein